jgi:nucleoside diphosphate kinase
MKPRSRPSFPTSTSRNFVITGYADSATTRAFASVARGFLCVMPAALHRLGSIVEAVEGAYTLMRMRQSWLSGAASATGDGEAGMVVAMELMSSAGDCDERWAQLCGEGGALAGVAGALRFSSEQSTPPAALQKQLDFFFTGPGGSGAPTSDCSLLVVKPHAVKAGQTGQIIDAVLAANFEIVALDKTTLAKQEASTFLSAYNGVVEDHTGMVHSFLEGPCLALAVRTGMPGMRATSGVSVKSLRAFTGPYDVEIARTLRPTSLRARFGRAGTFNAVHCTDLPEDAVLECRFFFGA